MKSNSVDFFQKTKIPEIPGHCDLILAVWQIANPENVGRIIRLAHNAGARMVLFVNDTLHFRETKIKKVAGFSFRQMDWKFITEDEFRQIITQDYTLVALETSEGSKNIFRSSLPEKIILLGGSESHGIPSEILKLCDQICHIPMPGECKSMNISHALSVAAFEWYRQMTQEKKS